MLPLRKRLPRALFAACAGVAGLALGSGAAAATAMKVRVDGCAGVDGHEVERLIGLELAFVGAAEPSTEGLQIDLVCSGARLRMSALDPLTGKQLEREVALGPPEPGRDRTIALLTSQLFLTSWAERFLERPPTIVVPPNAGPAPPSTPSARWEVSVGAGVRLRDPAVPSVDPRLAVRPSMRLGRFRALLDLAYERGNADRAGGSVAWWMGSAGIGAGWRSKRRGPVALDATLTGSALFIDVRGQPTSTAFAGDSAHGLVGEAAIGAGPSASWGRFRIGLELQTGAVWPSATARTMGDRDVALTGLWAGATLFVGDARETP